MKAADALVAAGSFEQAIEKYESALNADPENIKNALKIGGFLINCQQTEKAYLILQKSAFYEPGNNKIFGMMGLALINLGRTDEAEICLQRAVELNPKDKNSRLLLTGLKEKQASGEGLARAAETLTMILSYSDQPEKMEEILKRVDSNLLAVVRANAVTARQDGQNEMAGSLDELAKNLENLIIQRILGE